MSIRLRLTLWYGIALAVIVVVVAAVVWVQLGRDLRASLAEALAVQADDVDAALDLDSQASLSARDPGRPGIFTIIFGADGALVRATDGAPEIATPTVGSSEASAQGHAYALYAVRASNGQLVVSGASLSEIDRPLDRLGGLLLLVGGLTMLAALAGGWWLAGRALAPVERVARELSAIGTDELGRRVSQPLGGDEIGRLSGAINAMLGRIDDSVRRERAFVTAASHDLRTPIAVLRTELELADGQDVGREELLQTVRDAHSDVVRLSNLANDLLALAEAEPGGRALARAPVAANDLVSGSADDQQALARTRAVHLETDAPAEYVDVDRVRVTQALRNLLANAIRFSPRGGTVTVNAVLVPDPDGRSSLVVHVLDRGPGVAAEVRPMLFLPFAGQADDGHVGLGLATAAAAVHAHGGQIEYADRSGGGADFSFSVPAR